MPQIAQYVTTVAEIIANDNCESIVEIGCGDFRVSGLLLEELREKHSWHGTYTGVDIVRPLIDYLQDAVTEEGIAFRHLDAVTDDLPQGDILIVRQVLQHLSNAEIGQILYKLAAFKCVIVTEHRVDPALNVGDNVDMPHSSGTRIEFGSSVVLGVEPFEGFVWEAVCKLPVGEGVQSGEESIETVVAYPGIEADKSQLTRPPI